jgi:hypothetical protein
MASFAGPVASAAWILARAPATITGTKTATVIYGDTVRPITRPGRKPAQVTEFAAVDGTEKFCKAVDALDAALDLARPGTARLLDIVSDGRYTADERTGGQQRLTRFARSGCGILWLAPTAGQPTRCPAPRSPSSPTRGHRRGHRPRGALGHRRAWHIARRPRDTGRSCR